MRLKTLAGMRRCNRYDPARGRILFCGSVVFRNRRFAGGYCPIKIALSFSPSILSFSIALVGSLRIRRVSLFLLSHSRLWEFPCGYPGVSAPRCRPFPDFSDTLRLRILPKARPTFRRRNPCPRSLITAAVWNNSTASVEQFHTLRVASGCLFGFYFVVNKCFKRKTEILA